MIIIFFFLTSFSLNCALPNDLLDLEECGLIAEVYLINEDIEYLEMLEEEYNKHKQAERTNPETQQGCDVPISDRKDGEIDRNDLSAKS